MRGHRLAFATVIVLLLGWRAVAHAAFIMAPGTLATPATSLNVASSPAMGTLTNDNFNGNNKVDIVVGTCSGSGNGAFTFMPANTISFNVSVSVSVRYTPSTLGPRSCSVSVFNQGQTSNALTTFTVTGDGQRPPTISPGTIMPFPSVRAFDNATAAHTSTRTLTITNTGDRTLNISSVVTSGDFSIDGSSANGTGMTTINGNNSSKNWILKFNPSAVGTRNGTITFNSNDPASPAKVVDLTGDGTSGAFTISQGANGNFGTVASGTSATLDIAVQHSGGNPKGILTFGASTITNASQSWFTVTAEPNTLTGTTTSGNVTIRCSPPALATATATATVNILADSDGSSGPGFTTALTQNISCQGGASVLALSMSGVDFEPTLVGTTSPAKTVTISNSGTSDASVQFTPNGNNAPRFSAVGPGSCGGGTPCTIPMAVGAVPGTVDVTVRFSPIAEGSVGASFQLTGGGPQVGFSVSGRGIDRHINLPDAVHDDK
jgi:hypothetical protein